MMVVVVMMESLELDLVMRLAAVDAYPRIPSCASLWFAHLALLGYIWTECWWSQSDHRQTDVDAFDRMCTAEIMAQRV